MQTIALAVTHQNPVRTARRAYALPVKIGRGSHCDIQLDAENRAISRVHLEIVEERGRIAVYNRASNLDATHFNGRALKPNERIEIVPGDKLRVFETEVLVLEPARLGVMVARRADLKSIGAYHLVPGGALLVCEIEGVLTVEPIGDLTGPDSVGLDTTRLSDRLAMLFYYDGVEPTFAVISNPERLPVMLDRGLVEQPALYIHSEDTIEVGAHRFEVLTIGEPGIVCENMSCQVLNDSSHDEVCRLCGTRLFGATRMLRVRTL